MSLPKARVNLAFLLTTLLVLTGCSRSIVSTNFRDPEFSLADLRTSPSLLVVSPEVRVLGFKKPFHALFADTTDLSVRISQKIRDSLSLETTLVLVPSVPDSTLRKLLDSTGSKHVIYLRTVDIKDTAEEMEDVLLPGIGGMQPSRGGTTKSCIVTFGVDILDSTLAKRYAFTVKSKANVPLYAYKTALLIGLDAASRKTARHLAGR